MTINMIGYKGTDKNMRCRGLQYAIGEWQEVEGELVECENGLHFCEQLAHVFSHYHGKGDRYFECEAEDVLETTWQPGVKEKFVARRLRLTKEIFILGDQNTGDQNTGNQNTGNQNTGDWNAGDQNTGDWNTGDQNTGDWNAGDQNTGYWNAGYQNTGDRNTGYWNTGDWNAGYWNTGSWNTGDQNTGSWNACNYSAGFFNTIDPKVISFDQECSYNHSEYTEKFGRLSYELGVKLSQDKPISVDDFADIPNITQEKLDKLHRLHINGRKKMVKE